MNNNAFNMLKEFQNFKNSMSGKNAKQEVEKLLKSGQMTNEQFEQLKKQAEDFMKFFR